MSKRGFWVLMSLATILFSILYVRTRFLVVELSYRLDQGEKETRKLEQQKQELSLELAILKSPARIETIASKNLGLERMRDVRVVNLSTKGKR